MERIKIAVLLIITVLTACTGRARNGTIVINLDKPSSKGFNFFIGVPELRRRKYSSGKCDSVLKNL